MNLIKTITSLFAPAYKTAAYRYRLATLFKNRKGPVQVQGNCSLPDEDMYRYIGKLSNQTWAAKVLSERKDDWFSITYFGELLGETIIMTDDPLAAKVKIKTRLNEEIELFDLAYDGYDALLVDLYEEDKLEERTCDKKYVAENGESAFRIMMVVEYHEETERELNEQLQAEGKIMDDFDREIDLNLALNNSFSYIAIYAFDKKGKVYKIIDEETA
jgi:hypothetical protein